MTQKQLELKVEHLERQLLALASRPYTARAEDASAEARKANDAAEAVNAELLESAVTMTDFMEEYYLTQLGL